ncbi:hypothetical protein SELMODRAFT_420699 [Selaginella moellendorffii]|uniref:Pentacotripeptide-repeat region of PRORP domain-containing protein n=1 Tax=Selaginella moellendorffii TaxID=88036 RepID=D8SCU4_SELML|nr:pentatricopeptide repeat-containing protein At1g02370, mitochondrial [Selaginella moellendorffii]EFJ17769.1 hypothetical protein SELMODRAFT_420699 [Selaginella moellendorffii]|eukprot:XP_002981068.1 pentatricopeptide repeat-containing protein At1g02370, mitochondrial [Selaginella moellendorffii]
MALVARRALRLRSYSRSLSRLAAPALEQHCEQSRRATIAGNSWRHSERRALLLLPPFPSRGFRRVRFRLVKADKDDPEEEEPDGIAEEDDFADTIDLTLVQKRQAERLWNELLPLTIPSVGPVVKLTIGEDRKIGLPGILYVVGKLRTFRRSKQALSILDWLAEEKPFGEFDESLYKLHISIAFEVNSVHKAEKIFESVPKELQLQEKLLGAMAAGYASAHRMDKVEEILLQCNLSAMEPYTALIKLYFRVALYDKAASLYKRIKAAKLEPDLAAFAALLREKSSLESLKPRELEEDAEVALHHAGAYEEELTIKAPVASQAMVVSGYLGKAAQVSKLWKHIKQEKSSSIPAVCYLNAIEAFGAAGKVRSAEKVADEMEMAKSKYVELSAAMIRVYSRNQMADKAEAVIDDLRANGVWNLFRPHAELITGYLDSNQPDQAMKALKVALLVKLMKPTYAVILKMLPVFERLRDAEGAEDMVMRYKGATDLRMYKGLLRIYVSAKVKPLEEIEARLMLKKIPLDEETRELLTKLRGVIG